MTTYMDRRFFLTGVIIAGAWVSSATAQPAPFKLTIARKFKGEKCTSGYFSVNSRIIAYALERPWRGNAPVVSSIPTGTYNGILRYDHSDRWRIELTGVLGRNNIQIHIGNTPDDTQGCVLVGLKLGDDLCSVQNSRQAYEALRVAFYGDEDPISSPNKSILVTVEE